MKNIIYPFMLALIVSCVSVGVNKGEKPVTLEMIKKELIKNISTDWEIKENKIGSLLHGSVQIGDLSEQWSKAGIIICDKNIPNILTELAYLKMSAPFEIVYLSKHYQIITWASKDLENIKKVIEIVKKLDS